MRKPARTLTLAGLLLAAVQTPAIAQKGPVSDKAPISDKAPLGAPAPVDLDAAIAKSNAYIGLMNRTLRAVESWDRYTSWVDVKKGPTGRERYIDYGLYGLYDVADEIAKARAAMAAPPAEPDLDANMARYIAAYEELAPHITAAEGYYERKDYKDDAMKEGKALHAKLVPAAKAFITERTALELRMRAFRKGIDSAALTAIEAKEGRNQRWHIRNVMLSAEAMINRLPTNRDPVVDMKNFKTDLATFAQAVRELDSFSAANPGKMSSFGSMPRSLLGKLRDFGDQLDRVKGDARRMRSLDLPFIISDYNMMVSMADMAVRFSR